MPISFYNFKDLHNEEFRKEAKNRLSAIIDQNAFVEGEYNTLFENDFAQMQKTKHCLLVANGTDALEIALKAYDIGHGDKVGVPAISFFATAEAIINVGAIPVFVDIDSRTGLMDTISLKRVLEDHNLKAIMPVHIYGLPAPIDELEKICKPKNIRIIEDGAQAQGTFYGPGRPAGSSNNLTTFSFYPTKNLAAFGDAGCILTQTDDLAEKIKSIRNHGRSPNGHCLIGRNSRCDSFQAAVLHLKLRHVEEYNNRRKQVAKMYNEALKDMDIAIVPESFIDKSSWHLYPVQLHNRDQKYALKYYLSNKSIASSLFYEKAMPEEKPLEQVPGEKKNALAFAAQTLCLPINPFMTESEVAEVADAIGNFLNNR